MLATTTESIPSGTAWVHEVKWDGMRVLADVREGSLRLLSRTGRDVTVAFPELAPLADEYPDMLLDGEVVVLRDGVPSFAALAERFGVTDRVRAAALAATAPATLMAFDLLRLYGVDITARTWEERRATLERLELAGGAWQVPPYFTDGEALWQATRAQGLEGIVSKRRDAAYASGSRSPAWRKAAHRRVVSVVVGGWRPETTDARRRRLGAVLVGVPGPDGLAFAGRVGSGLTGRAGEQLRAELDDLVADASPFAEALAREDTEGTFWVRPELVVDVRYLGRGAEGRLRQPTYLGRRVDLGPGDVRDLDAQARALGPGGLPAGGRRSGVVRARRGDG